MKLEDILHRTIPPQPWAEADNIPWDDPEFSQRMLKEHLSQEHDAASRKLKTVERHVAWIFQRALGGKVGSVLDLCCGPGLYTSRLARLGCTCLGVDFSPASVAYARQQAQQEGLPCTYIHQDVRTADYGCGHDLVSMIFGEFNIFKFHDAQSILTRARAALKPGGRLLLEVHKFETVRLLAEGRGWHSAQSGLFSDQPYLVLEEGFWDEVQQTATRRIYIVRLKDGLVSRIGHSLQAYDLDGYAGILGQCGFSQVQFCDDFGEESPDLFVILAGND
jgi:SAM-dependent methyltransferase